MLHPLIVLLLILRAATQPATGSIAGRVTAAAGQLPEMIVFLEPVNPATVFGPPAQRASISQKGAKFSPSLLVVSVGQTVDFHNDEDRPIEHNVFSRSSARPFDLGLYRPPETRSVVFDKPGPVRLYCSIHRYMDGLIYVCPTPFFARVAPDGSYRIDAVPVGDWRLKTWQRSARFNEQDRPLAITTAPQTTINLEMRRE
jgi:plastocyanin